MRVQHVETQRGVFEQTFGLATVIVHNAAGAHTIPLLAQADAEELRERIAGLGRATTRDDRSPGSCATMTERAGCTGRRS